MQPLTNASYEHIEGLKGREPVGAVLTIGQKAASGNPTDNDRFFIKVPIEERQGEMRVRPNHPLFKAFNEAPAERRRSIQGNLVHSTREDCWHHYLRAQVLGGNWPTHPSGMPACQGDGKTATRLYAIGAAGERDDFREIPCPHDRCEFRQGTVKACKPFGRFYFRPRWAENSPLPTPLTKLTTASWNSVKAFIGFFDYVLAQAAALGIDEPVLYGLPFTITLTRKTQPQHKRAFPVLTITPEIDLIAFFLAQRQRLKEIGEGRLVPLLSGARSPEETEPTTIAADHRLITPTMPGPAEPAVDDADEEKPTLPTEEPPRLSAEALARIRGAAGIKHLSDSQVESMAGGRLEEAPASAETEILRTIERYKPTRR